MNKPKMNKPDPVVHPEKFDSSIDSIQA